MHDPGQAGRLSFQDRETGKILLADTVAESRSYIKDLLESKGYEVITTEEGAATLNKIEKNHPDLVIIDTMLPQIDGLQLCRILRSKQETRLLPIVLLTSKTELDDKTAGFESGADDYIMRPFHPYELLARVRSLLAIRRLQIQAAESEKLEVIRELSSVLGFEISHSINTILDCTHHLENVLKIDKDPRLTSRIQTITYHTSRIKMILDKLVEIAGEPTTKVRLG